MKDTKGDIITIYFNKSYQPYCAYRVGYSCPIVPEKNKLPIKIRAGIMYQDIYYH